MKRGAFLPLLRFPTPFAIWYMMILYTYVLTKEGSHLPDCNLQQLSVQLFRDMQVPSCQVNWFPRFCLPVALHQGPFSFCDIELSRISNATAALVSLRGVPFPLHMSAAPPYSLHSWSASSHLPFKISQSNIRIHGTFDACQRVTYYLQQHQKQFWS